MSLSLSETAVLIELALRNRDVRAMRKINDRCISECALRYSEPAYSFALIAYVLSKVISKPRYYEKNRPNEIISSISPMLLSCERHAESGDASQLFSAQGKVLLAIEKLDDEDRRFVKGILLKGRLKIAATLYAQGLSLGSAASITQTDKREVLSYAGQTMMFDRVKEKKTIDERMKELRKAFS